MDDDDEIHPPPSPASGSPLSSPQENGRITVTVAAPAPQQPPPSNTLALALPIQAKSTTTTTGTGGGGGGREDCWSEGATAVLIEAWGDRYVELSRGNLKQKHWKEVAEIVSGREDYTKTPKTDIQCKNRIDTVKKKYKLEKSKIAAGGAPSKWPFFHRLDYLIGPTAKIHTPPPKLPLAIPVGIRTVNQFPHQKNNHQNQSLKNNNNNNSNSNNNQKIQFRRRAIPPPPPQESDSSEPDAAAASADSSDGFPPESYERKRRRLDSKRKGWGSAVRELTQAILKFGEAYEHAESSKIEQVVEMEKQRMKFAKDLELQRMQFFMKTQLEISQLKLGRKAGNASNHHSNNNNNLNNNSD